MRVDGGTAGVDSMAVVVVALGIERISTSRVAELCSRVKRNNTNMLNEKNKIKLNQYEHAKKFN